MKAEELAAAKEQFEDGLENLRQALFEEANKMVTDADRKAAETEEELRVITDQRDALKGPMRIVGMPLSYFSTLVEWSTKTDIQLFR
ncbi:hypothetical protein M422DRAFT_37746 [Sphaerobolus stellatus SS14]|uniref:GDP/GTP exchange factor Sec2 N-terminal domain-containing protein n=1 Tax=Sphaerobolus stellatus (strain SS14) TaxID=990650 RepID=A0A0C9TE14_SPHS4|nr:hypothetical protein M422DRAFT_37746 [Sphaerobolus stellatus SS14]